MLKKLLISVTAVAGCGFFILTGQQAEPPAVYTVAQAEVGRAAYQSSCAKCHTDKLTGRKGEPGELPPLSSLAGDDLKMVTTYGGKVPPLAGAGFMAKWGARTTMDLSSRVGEAPAPAKEMYLNLTAYFLRANGARPGTQPLTADTAVEIRSLIAK
jgi:mono/diheme cytochrome c family protein